MGKIPLMFWSLANCRQQVVAQVEHVEGIQPGVPANTRGPNLWCDEGVGPHHCKVEHNPLSEVCPIHRGKIQDHEGHD